MISDVVEICFMITGIQFILSCNNSGVEKFLFLFVTPGPNLVFW